jgi:hypothetical protein
MQKCHLTKTQHLFITLKKLSEVEIEKNLVKNIYEKHIADVILNSKTEKELLPGSGIRQIYLLTSALFHIVLEVPTNKFYVLLWS